MIVRAHGMLYLLYTNNGPVINYGFKYYMLLDKVA